MTEVALPPGVRGDRIETLQARVAGNRWKFVAFTVAYVAAVAGSISSAVLLLVVLMPLITQSAGVAFAVLAQFPLIAKVTVAASVLAVSVWAGAALARCERTLLGRLGAEVPRPGTLEVTRSALKDMSLAAGFEHSPRLYVIETDRVNAFVLGRTRARAVVGVTRGFAERLSREDQRAVFANLLARVLSGDTLWATAVSALAGPVWALRDADLRRPQSTIAEDEAGESANAIRTVSARHIGPPLLGWWIFQTFVVVVTEVLAYWHQELAWRAAEKADAEGMLLLRDPREMLAALENVLARNNHVPSAGDAYSQLFYCWSGFGFAPESDPEARRVARLREVLGAEGLAVLPRPNVPDWPRAPRLTEVPDSAPIALTAPVETPVEHGPDGTRVLAGVALAAGVLFDVGLVAWRSGAAPAAGVAAAAAAVAAAAGVFWGTRLVTAQGSGGRQGRATAAVAFAAVLVLTAGAGILLAPVWLVATLAGVASGEELSREEWRRRFVRRYDEAMAERQSASRAEATAPKPEAPRARIFVSCRACGASNAPINRRCSVCGKKLKP
jgi:Zn-dependent protease with chaperone function